MIQNIKPGGLYWADINGKTTKVRVIEQSRELPHLWLCFDPDKGAHLLVDDSAFHQIKRQDDGATGR